MDIESLPVRYIDKSRAFYEAQGYAQSYRWAIANDAPFTELTKAVSEARVGVVTTAYPAGHSGPKQAYEEVTSPIPDAMNTDELAWDRDATHTNDLGSFLPLAHLESMATAGDIGSLAPRFFGVPTAYSHRRSQRDGERVSEWAKADDVDLMLLFPL